MINNEKSTEGTKPVDPRRFRAGYKFATVYYRRDGERHSVLGMITFFKMDLDGAIAWAKEQAPATTTNALVWAVEALGPVDPNGLIDVQEALIEITHLAANGNDPGHS